MSLVKELEKMNSKIYYLEDIAKLDNKAKNNQFSLLNREIEDTTVYIFSEETSANPVYTIKTDHDLVKFFKAEFRDFILK
jgi:hypothetical protein